MKTAILGHAAVALTAVALATTGCNVTEPDNAATPTVTSEQRIDTLQELEEFALRSGPSAVSQLLVVEMTARTCAALNGGGFVNTIVGNDGALQASWTDENLLRMWSLKCWNGSPMFPGGEELPICGFDLAMPRPIECLQMIEAAVTVLRGMHSIDGYTFLYQNVSAIDQNEEFEVWFADPEGRVMYWRWIQSGAVDVPNTGVPAAG